MISYTIKHQPHLGVKLLDTHTEFEKKKEKKTMSRGDLDEIRNE